MEKTLKVADKLAIGRNPASMVALNISNQGLKEITGIQKFKNIVRNNQTEIDLSRNQLIRGFEEIFTLKYLKKVNLARNSIEKIWPLPPSLEVLNLAGNLIEEISDSLSSLKKLQSLDISSNFIQSLSGVMNLKGLKILNASCNKIKSSQGVENMGNLVDLDLSGNQIQRYEDLRFLNSAGNLELVNLKGNSVLE